MRLRLHHGQRNPAVVHRRTLQGVCDNGLTIRRDEVEARVLAALQEKLLNQELFEEFCDELTREMNRLRMQYRADLTAAHARSGASRSGARSSGDKGSEQR